MKFFEESCNILNLVLFVLCLIAKSIFNYDVLALPLIGGVLLGIICISIAKSFYEGKTK